jgi:uncharacterized protein Usg
MARIASSSGTNSDITLALKGYRLTTAEILYHLPDHPALLQSYVWQDWDKAPTFPELKGFLRFWTRSLDGRLHSVRVGVADPMGSGNWCHLPGIDTLQ